MKIRKLYLLIISIIALISCSERDGEADAMEWTTNVSQMNDDCIEVPQSGNSYIFECTNYSSFWLGDIIRINGEAIQLSNEVRDEYKNEWLTVKIEKNILSVDIVSNESSENRNAVVVLIVGNMTDSFTFNQKGNLGHEYVYLLLQRYVHLNEAVQRQYHYWLTNKGKYKLKAGGKVETNDIVRSYMSLLFGLNLIL